MLFTYLSLISEICSIAFFMARPDEEQNGSTIANLHQRFCFNRVQTVLLFREAKPRSCALTGIAVGCTVCFGIVKGTN